jgi:peptidoglycan/xylan/chitin deacetylase (PgdA/CDA1 family)
MWLRSWKRRVEAILVGTGVARLARVVLRPGGVVLAYHNVLPAGAQPVGDRSLHLPVAAFESHLEALAAIGEVVPLEAVLRDPIASSRRLRIALTFDDAYRGAVTVGVDTLVRRGMPATVFVTPAFVDGGPFWWDSLSDAALGAVPPAARDHALQQLQGDDGAVRRWAASTGRPTYPVPAYATAASESELQGAARQPGIVLGSHTWSHRNLASLADDVLQEELTRPLAWLLERFQAVMRWVSYPYGLYSPRVVSAAARAGYTAGFALASPAPRAGRSSAFEVPRGNVPSGMTSRGVVLRASGAMAW